MNWEGNTEIPVVATSDQSPALAAFNSQLWMVYKGRSGNDIYWATYDGNTWQGNEKIEVTGGSNLETDGSPALTVFNNRLWIVYKTPATRPIDGYIYWSTYDGNTWTTPVPILVDSNTSPVPTNASPTPTIFSNQVWIGYKGGVGGGSANNLYSVNGSVPG